MTTALKKSKEQPDIFMQNCISVFFFFFLGKVLTYFIKFSKEFINPKRLLTLPGLPEFLDNVLTRSGYYVFGCLFEEPY